MPIAGRYAYQLREFPGHLESMGIEVSIPSWWKESIEEYAYYIPLTVPQPEEIVLASEPGAVG